MTGLSYNMFLRQSPRLKFFLFNSFKNQLWQNQNFITKGMEKCLLKFANKTAQWPIFTWFIIRLCFEPYLWEFQMSPGNVEMNYSMKYLFVLAVRAVIKCGINSRPFRGAISIKQEPCNSGQNLLFKMHNSERAINDSTTFSNIRI